MAADEIEVANVTAATSVYSNKQPEVIRKMPVKGRRKQAKESIVNANKIDLRATLENLDEKARRNIDYLLKDFRLQRDHAVQEIPERKQHYFNLINAYYDKIPKIAPRRYLNMTCGNFELDCSYLTIDYMKFIDRPTQFMASALNRKRDVLKYGGTPAKFKVTYSATKRKSTAKSEIKHFEFRRISGNGHKGSIIVSANKRSTGQKSAGKRIPASGATDVSLEEDRKLRLAMRQYRVTKFCEVNRHRHADIDNKQANKRVGELLPQLDGYFDRIIASLTREQANCRMNERAQRGLISDLDLNYVI